MQKSQEPKADALATAGDVNTVKALTFREIQQMSSVFVESGFFPNIKTAAQAMVKIIAGQELGFAPVVSMTGIHFFLNRVDFSSTLKASLIKASGKYNYKILDHSTERCEISFFEKVNNEWVSCGVPVVYTIGDAKVAGLTNKDNWKNHPKDMLFAACIRQGQRRYCADVLHGLGNEQDAEFADEQAAVDASAFENAKAENQTVDAESVEATDVTTGEPIDVEVVGDPQENASTDADQSRLVDLRTAVKDLLIEKCGGMPSDQKKILKGRDVDLMELDALDKLHAELLEM